MNKKDCIMCRDNLGIKQCWSFDPKKKCETRYIIRSNVPMNIKSAYIKTKKPPCYSCESGRIILDKIPGYAK